MSSYRERPWLGLYQPGKPADITPEVLGEHDGARPAPLALGPGDIALLTYTSGTTGTAGSTWWTGRRT